MYAKLQQQSISWQWDAHYVYSMPKCFGIVKPNLLIGHQIPAQKTFDLCFFHCTSYSVFSLFELSLMCETLTYGQWLRDLALFPGYAVFISNFIREGAQVWCQNSRGMGGSINPGGKSILEVGEANY